MFRTSVCAPRHLFFCSLITLMIAVVFCPGAVLALDKPDVLEPECKILADSAVENVKLLYDADKIDSALRVLQNLTDRCGVSQEIEQLVLLLHIVNGTFSEDLYNRAIIDNLLSGQRTYQYKFWRREYYGWQAAADVDYKGLIERLARKARSVSKPGTVERLLADHFSGDSDSTFYRLKQPEYRNSKLAAYYRARCHELSANRSEAHMAFYSGMFMPQGDGTTVGNHPVIGGIIGGIADRFCVDIASEIRLVDSRDAFIVDHNGKVDTTKQYLGYYVGLEVGRELLRTMRSAVLFKVGAGFDGFGYGHVEKGQARAKIHAFNGNVGMEYRWAVSRYSSQYMGLAVMYNFLGYDRNGGADIKGNAISIRVIWGFVTESNNDYDLKRLDY